MDQHTKPGKDEQKQEGSAAESRQTHGHSCCGGHGHDHHHGHGHDHGHGHHGHGNGEVIKDPVCGMTVDPNAGKPSFDFGGTVYHFCSSGCLTKFQSDPKHYISGAHKKPAKNVPVGTKYTCPMHPEIVQDGPGDCPICGMALEPMGMPTGEEGPNLELIDFTRRFWIGAVLTVPQALSLPQIADRGMLASFENVPGADRDIRILRTGITSPMGHGILKITALTPSHLIKRQVDDWRQQSGI